MKEIINKSCNSKSYQLASDKDKVLFILYDHVELSQEKVCSLVLSPVSFVSDVFGDKKDKKDKNKLSRVKISVKKSLLRLQEENKIIINKNNNPPTYSLLSTGEGIVKNYLEKEEEEQNKIIENERIKEELKYINYRRFDAVQLVEMWNDFIDLYPEIIINKNLVIIDYKQLSSFSPELAEDLIDVPENFIEALKHTVTTKTDYDVDVEIKSFPDAANISLKDIRTKNINNLIQCVAEIESVSETRPVIINMRFECPSCGNIISINQNDQKIKTPNSCACGRKGQFRVVHKERTDEIVLWITQPLAELFGDNFIRSRIKLFLRGSLTKNDLVNNLSPGKIISVCGIVKDLAIILKNGGTSTREDLCIFGYGIKPLETFDVNLKFTEEEIESFNKAVTKKTFLDELSISAFPNHCGDSHIKKALILQLLAGSFIKRSEKENLHILLVGDPGTGKTKLFRQVVKLAPLGRYTETTKASKAGLVGSAGQQDPFTGKRIFEPGDLPKANRGIITIDEFSSLKEEDPKVLNEAMASGELTFSKANVHVIIPADVRVLAGMNPPGGKFDTFTSAADSLKEVDSSVVDRFSLIYVVKDLFNEQRDSQVADNILGLEQSNIEHDFVWIRRFITFARHRINPVLRKEEGLFIKDLYMKLRKQSLEKRISPRFIAALLSLVLLSAKLRLSNVTGEQDLKVAAELMNPMLKAFNIDDWKI